MPTRRRRHSITETPPVQAALDDLRRELGEPSIDLAEIVILGAREKLDRVRRTSFEQARLRRELAELIRSRRVPVDPGAAEEVRRTGWARG